MADAGPRPIRGRRAARRARRGGKLAEAKRVPVGRVTGMSNTHWADPAFAAKDPTTVLVGMEYTLADEKSLLEITYDTGTKVILEGPAAYVVESANSGFLRSGKITVRVAAHRPPEHRDVAHPEADGSLFWLRSGTVDVINRGGGEFAVSLHWASDREFGTTYAEVFRGTIKVGLPTQNDDVISLDKRAPALITVDKARVLVYYGNSQLRRRSSRGNCRKRGQCIRAWNETKPRGEKDIRPSGRIPKST